MFQVAEEKANQREKTYKEQIKTLTSKLKQAEARAEFAEKSVQKLQKEVRSGMDEMMVAPLFRWTGWRMSWWRSRRSTRPSWRSSSRPSLRCLDTRNWLKNVLELVWDFVEHLILSHMKVNVRKY